MAELSTDTPSRFPHENQSQYLDRKDKYEQLLKIVEDEDDAQALSMVYSNMVYLQARYPAEVESKLAFIPAIQTILSAQRDDSAERVQRVIKTSREAFAPQKK